MLEVLLVLYDQKIQYQCALMLTGFLCFVLDSQRISALGFSFFYSILLFIYLF